MSINKNEKKTGAAGDQRSSQPPEADNDIHLLHWLEEELGKALDIHEFSNLKYGKVGYTLASNANQKHVVGLNLDEIKLSPTSALIRRFHHLQILSLSECELTNIFFIEGMRHLTYLDLSWNPIKDHTFLQGLNSLTHLNLSYNEITDISFLQGLSNLTHLYLSGNKLTDITFLQGLSQLTVLDLSYNQITDISCLQGMNQLIELDLRDNKITDISVLQGMSQLTELNLNLNQITDISFLQGLSQLTQLYLSNNQITDISCLQGLSNLKKLDLSLNKITQLPEAFYDWDDRIYLLGNPLEKPPIEIIKKGKKAIKAYFDSLKEETLPLNEVKVLLVGDGAAGKTSLVNRLLGLAFDKDEPQTHGINIKPWTIQHGHKTIKAHLWDFGGQEIMHATHQFFLSKRSLYLLVLDGRKDEKTEYWLKHIESFGGDSPVLAVINKTDANPGFELNRKFLQDKYPNLKSFYRVSCKTNEGFDALVPALEKALSQVEMIRTTWATSWFEVKTQLENMKEPFLCYREYREICSRQEITDKTSQDTLVDFLNDLGVILHFKDLELHDTHVLDPKWATEAVYKIINSKQLAEHSGVLQLDLLEEILKPTNEHDYDYPPDKYPYIIELMIKFELCYRLDTNRVLIPNLLAAEERLFEFDYDASLKFIIEYDFLPPSVMPRFIVRMHRDIKDGMQWRTGVVLADKAFHATAVVKCDERERRIFIYVNGEQKRDYFSIIRKTIRDINGSFEKLETKELVPLPDNDKITVEYEELTGYEAGGKSEIYIGKLRKGYSVTTLLDGIEVEKERIKNYPGGSEKYFNYIDKAFLNSMEVKVTETKSVQFGDNATIHGDFVFADRIRDSFNKVSAAEAPDNLKGLLKSLAGDVEKVIEQLPKEKAEGIVNDLQSFLNEAVSKKPRKQWWELSANGIKEAAKTVGTIGLSALKNMDKIIPLLEKL